MDVWPQREKFKAYVKAYQKSTGKSQRDVAEALDVARSSLRFWMYQQKRKPSLDILTRAAKLFNCSVTEFVDDPAGLAKVPGVEQEAWSELSERDRVIASAMFADITADDLSEQDKDLLYAAWKEEVAKLRRYKGAGS
jgi:transcriptional regulator with XRE-family HTH domain